MHCSLSHLPVEFDQNSDMKCVGGNANFQVWQVLTSITTHPPCYTLYGRTLRVKTSGKNIEYNTNLLEAIIYVKDVRKIKQIGKNTPSVKTPLAELEDMHTDGLTPKLATVYRHLDKKDTKTEAQAVADHNVLMGRLEIGQCKVEYIRSFICVCFLYLVFTWVINKRYYSVVLVWRLNPYIFLRFAPFMWVHVNNFFY